MKSYTYWVRRISSGMTAEEFDEFTEMLHRDYNKKFIESLHEMNKVRNPHFYTD